MHRWTLVGFGAVMLPPMRWPPQLTPAPASSHRIVAPRSRALSRLSIRTTPEPEPGMNPPALAESGREAFSGSSFEPRFSTRIASKPDQM